MSAYILDKNFINYLVNFLEQNCRNYDSYFETWELPSKPDDIGQVLVAQNFRSVNYRYNEGTQIPGYTFKLQSYAFNPLQVLKSLACYEYQSCETEDWKETKAYKIIDAIKDYAIRALPGYDECEWDAPAPTGTLHRLV